MAPVKNALQKVLEMAGTFVTTQKGTWDHGDWERLLETLDSQGVVASDETKRNLGNILEASKYFYQLPVAPAKKKAAAKKPAAKKSAAKPAAKKKSGK